jgi:hypothetical protein
MLITTQQIKQDAELSLQWAHELDNRHDLDESERCAISECLDMTLTSLRDAIRDQTLLYVLPILREAESQWLSQNSTLPRGGFGRLLTYEDWQGIDQNFDTCVEWEYAVAVEEMPQPVQDRMALLGMALKRNNIDLWDLYSLIDALTGREPGYSDEPVPAGTNADRPHLADIDWREAGF